MTDARDALDDPIARRILEARTRALAAAPDRSIHDEIEAVSLVVGGERYEMTSEAISAVAEIRRLCALPHAPPELLGLTLRRGAVLPVFDLRIVLGAPLTALPEHGRLIVLGRAGEDVALAVDAIAGMRAIPRSELRDAAPIATPTGAWFRGIDADGVPVIDSGALLDSDRLVVDISPRGVGR
ncbi:MAG: chemotaxis protein CheW [Deltaproteobacteria bacterium]|nr:chemotaxis protein CheW [Deltaproteobacteria bacterium]